MDIGQTLALALLQGVTEFLPVSSSAHLALLPALLGWPDQGHAFDVAVHVGTLAAVLHYFRRDLRRWLRTGLRRDDPSGVESRRILLWLAVATAPLLLVGPLVYDSVAADLRQTRLIAWTTLGFGVLLWAADFYGRRQRELGQLHLGDALGIGLAQCLALMPGVSRSGIVMTLALLLGLRRRAAARIAFLLSIPAILAAGGLSGYAVAVDRAMVWDWGLLLLGMLVSGASAWLCVHVFLGVIERIGMLPFAVYRVALGAALLLCCA